MLSGSLAPAPRLAPRKGARKDVALLQKTFQMLNFEVVDYTDEKNNVSAEGIRGIIRDAVSVHDYKTYGALAVVISSHGGKGDNGEDIIYGSDCKTVPLREICNYCACESLQGIPKLFFVQACRGSEVDWAPVQTDGSWLRRRAVDTTVRIETNLTTNFVLSCATCPGFVALRDDRDGTWYLQTLCEALQAMYRTMHIVDILRKELPKRIKENYKWEDMTENPHLELRRMDDVYFRPDKAAALPATRGDPGCAGEVTAAPSPTPVPSPELLASRKILGLLTLAGGELYSSDQAQSCVNVFGVGDGKLRRLIGRGDLRDPRGCAVLDRTLFVANRTISEGGGWKSHVVAFPAAGGVRLREFGAGQLMVPEGVAVWERRVLVSEYGEDRVSAFEEDGNRLFCTPEGLVVRPSGLCVSGDHVFVKSGGITSSIAGHDRVAPASIIVLNAVDLTLDRAIGRNLSAPTGVCVWAARNLLFVADDPYVGIFNATTGDFVKSLGGFGEGHPKGVAVSDDGTLFVSTWSSELYRVRVDI